MAILKGRTLNASRGPLAGVTISVLDHPELGATASGADGRFEFALNGGGQVTLVYRKAGYLEIQRNVDPDQRNWAAAEDVRLIQPDIVGVVLDPPAATNWTVARASRVDDADGNRASTVLFAPGTTAAMRFADGSTQPRPAPWTVRQTEYTVGGPGAMPGSLPATTEYTYAVELAIDEAEAAGATSVEFTAATPGTHAVVQYVENFIDAPVGSGVPSGSYDRAEAEWEPEATGRVVKVVSETAGRADLDTDGDGDSDNDDYPAALKITDGERAALAPLYQPGAQLWRVPIQHFSEWDFNWGGGLPPGGRLPRLGPDGQPLPNGCPQPASSTIDCEEQRLREELPVPGTPYSLSYSSDWEASPADRRMKVRLIEGSVPNGLMLVRLQATVAGRTFVRRYAGAAYNGDDNPPPVVPDLEATIDWDGLDAGGDPVPIAKAHLTLFYYYAGVYGVSDRLAAFADYNQAGVNVFPARIGTGDEPATGFAVNATRVLGSVGRAQSGLGGWDFDAHHVYDALSGNVLLGDGTVRGKGDIPDGRLRTVVPFTGGGITSPQGNGDFDVLADGSIVYAGELNDRRIYRAVDGVATPIAGLAFADPFQPVLCDGRPAVQSYLGHVQDVAARPDGRVLLALAQFSGSESQGARICEITADGRLVKVAGAATNTCAAGVEDCRGDRGPAVDAPIGRPDHLVPATDGSLYFVEAEAPTNGQHGLIRKVDTAGVISTVAGGGSGSVDPTPGLPADDLFVASVTGLAELPSGALLLAADKQAILEIGTDGVVRTWAGKWNNDNPVPSVYDVDRKDARFRGLLGLAVDREGGVYAHERLANGYGVVRIRPDGIVVRVMGYGKGSCTEFGTPNVADLEGAIGRCELPGAGALRVGGDGSAYVFDRQGLRRIEAILPEVAFGQTAIASEDGSEVWIFDASGRHLRTVDGLLGSQLREFGYDAQGRLVRVQDADGRDTYVDRNAAGDPLAIVAPDGRRTTLAVNASARLSSVANPLGQARTFSYDAGGRLNRQDLPTGRHSSYVYEADDGSLTEANGAAGQKRTLSRITLDENTHQVDVTTGAGRTTRYKVERSIAGALTRTITSPSGAVTEISVDSTGKRTTTLPSGQKRVMLTTADARFGAAVPRPLETTDMTPSGKSATTRFAYFASLPAAGVATGPTSLTTTQTLPNGTVRTEVYNGAQRSFTTTTSPSGRKVRRVLDARARMIRLELGDQAAATKFAPVTTVYDGSGMTEMRQGNQVVHYERDAAGRPRAVVAADGARVEYDYDAADRLTARRYPGGRTYGYGYDADGVLVSRTLPSGKSHVFTPTGWKEYISRWTPPGVAGDYATALNADQEAESVTYPSGAVRTVSTDASGRMRGLALPGAARTFGYAAGTDRIETYASTAAPAGETQGLSAETDGMQLTTLTATGLAPAVTTIARSATTLRETSVDLAVPGEDPPALAIARDADGVPTGFGGFTYERNGPDRSLSAITDGTARTEETTDPVADLTTRVLKVGGVEQYRLELVTDATGRITSRREVDAGGDHTYAYAHDDIGALREVRRDGALTESYQYNLDGDRTQRTLAAGAPEAASYDAGGKLSSRGGVGYTFDADGFLAAHGGDTFVHDRSGDLRSATVGGTTVEYAYDAIGRRVARKQGTQLTQYIYGDLDVPWRISAARAPDGTLDQYLYGPRGNLHAILRGGQKLYVGTDQVGSPRVVVNASGTVVKRLSYDAYGAETDLDPGFFLPIGFAGGLRDPVSRLVRFGLRDYEPASGRFTARDPAGFDGSARNLYAYASNSPVSFRDPDGRLSLSFSAYAGGGGGVSLYLNPSAIWDPNKPLFGGACFEVGVGLGGGAETDLLEQGPQDVTFTGFAEAGVKVPFMGMKVGREVDLICGNKKFKTGANIGPLQWGVDDENTPSAGGAVDPAGLGETLLGGATGVKAEGKAGIKACLPPPGT